MILTMYAGFAEAQTGATLTRRHWAVERGVPSILVLVDGS